MTSFTSVLLGFMMNFFTFHKLLFILKEVRLHSERLLKWSGFYVVFSDLKHDHLGF